MTSLVTNHASRSGSAGANNPSACGRLELAQDEIGERLRRVGHLVGKELVEAPVLRGDETGRHVPRAVAADRADGLGDVEVQARDGIRQRARRLLVAQTLFGDHVLEDREQELVLAREQPIERLQRDAGFLHELLRREPFTAFGDEPAGGVDDDLGLFHLPRARTLHRRRAVGGAVGPGERRRLGRAHVGDSTTTGISRSVRVWYTL